MIMRFLGYFRRRAFASRTHFFPIFSRQAAYIRQASTALTAMMKTSDQSEWRRLEKEVKMCEVQGDAMLAEFYGELYENIVTPVDRDHLQTIAMYIDEFLDNINVSAKSILLYLPDRIDTGLLELAQYIESEADALKEIIAMNRNGVKPESLKTEPDVTAPEFVSAVGDDSITRFDETRKKKKRQRQGKPARSGQQKEGGERREPRDRKKDGRGPKPQKQAQPKQE